MINLDEKNLLEKKPKQNKKLHQNKQMGEIKPLLLKQIRTASSFMRFFSLYEHFILYS